MANFERDYAFGKDYHATDFVADPATFLGIVRPDGASPRATTSVW
jgi:altronate hydrolase